MVLIMTVFMYVFSNIKAAIPILHPLEWDTYFAQLDSTLHFGTQPWVWLQPLLGYAPVTYLININYNFWFLVTWIMWVHFSFADKPSELRTRFFLSFFAMWAFIGGALAVWFSSAGPCFYGRLGLTPDPFADLMAYLRGVNEVLPIWAIPVQDELWRGYTDNSIIVRGISAMPSMHNGFGPAVCPCGLSGQPFCWPPAERSRHPDFYRVHPSGLALRGGQLLGLGTYAGDLVCRWHRFHAGGTARRPQGDFDRALAAGA